MNWFEQITGFAEGCYSETQARLSVVDGRLQSETGGSGYAVGTLDFITLETLRERSREKHVLGNLSLGIIEGDVRQLHAAPENAQAVFQVASQFNLLEMVGPNVTPEDGVTRYAYDRTQGPACAMAAGAGTIWRNYLVPVGDQIGQTATRQLDGLTDIGEALAQDMGVPREMLWRMSNGYALPAPGALAQIEAYLANLPEDELDRLRGLLRVGVHRDVGVTEAGASADARVTQVYCSALPVAYSGIAATKWTHFAPLILEAAYEATVLAAVINAANGGSRKLFLTRIGGGAFGNDDAWINAAILRALHRVADQGIEVLMVSYGPPTTAICALEAAWKNKSTR